MPYAVLPADASLLSAYRLNQSRRNLSSSACAKRACSLRLLAKWVEPRRLVDATTADIEEWLDSRRLGPQGRAWHVSNLAAFFKWCVQNGVLDIDPTVRVVRPRLPRRLPRPWAAADIAMAVQLADDRMRCWLLLAGLAGLRCKEIAAMKREDLLDGVEPPLILVANGKGNHPRLVPIHPALLSALYAHGLPLSGPLWVGQRGPLSANTVSAYIARFLHGLNIADTAHRGRHHFATRLYQESKDLMLVKNLLGHVSLSTAAGYVAWDLTGAADVVARIDT